MAGHRTAQTSVEFLAILAISLVIITIVMVLAQQQITTVQKQKDSADAQNSLLDLSAAAKEVYAQGEGSKKQVFIRLPGSYEPDRSSISDKSIQIRAAGTDYVALENFNVHGYLPATSGGHWVWVTSEGNRVRIGPGMMELGRNSIYLVMNRNTTATASFSVKNVWVRAINVTTQTEWGTTGVGMSGVPSSFSLDVDGTEVVSLQFSADADAGGLYNGDITLNADDGQGATESVEVPVTVYVVGYTTPETDLLGPIITSISQIPSPALIYEPLAILLTTTDEHTGNSTIRGCEIDADQAGSWQAMLPVDGAFNQPTENATYNYTAGFSWGVHSIRARCTDAANNTGPLAFYYFNVTQADLLGPIVTNLTHTQYPTTLTNLTVSAIAIDIYTGGSNIRGCQVRVDAGAWHNASAMDGAYDSASENISYNVGPLQVGYHTINWQCVDVLGNAGGVYNDSFGVVDVDIMLVLDKSGSMGDNVTNVANNGVVSAASSGWSSVKSLTMSTINGDLANVTTEIKSNSSGCMVLYNITINGVTVATGNRTSTTYVKVVDSVNISAYPPPVQFTLWLKRNKTGCTVYNQLFSVQQAPSKMKAAQASAKLFVSIVSPATQIGLVTFTTTASTDKTLATMDPANMTALNNAIDAITPAVYTCIECGLVNGVNELISSRGRSGATRVIILLTDGISNYNAAGQSITDPASSDNAGALYCRNNNVTVYTIGLGTDVSDTELTNIALLTGGEYYFAPNVATLTSIFENIGK